MDNMVKKKETNVVVDPWGSTDIKDYSKNFKKFGLKSFTEEMKTNFDYFLFERDMIVAHRDFEKILERIKQKIVFKKEYI